MLNLTNYLDEEEYKWQVFYKEDPSSVHFFNVSARECCKISYERDKQRLKIEIYSIDIEGKFKTLNGYFPYIVEEDKIVIPYQIPENPYIEFIAGKANTLHVEFMYRSQLYELYITNKEDDKHIYVYDMTDVPDDKKSEEEPMGVCEYTYFSVGQYMGMCFRDNRLWIPSINKLYFYAMDLSSTGDIVLKKVIEVSFDKCTGKIHFYNHTTCGRFEYWTGYGGGINIRSTRLRKDRIRIRIDGYIAGHLGEDPWYPVDFIIDIPPINYNPGDYLMEPFYVQIIPAEPLTFKNRVQHANFVSTIKKTPFQIIEPVW